MKRALLLLMLLPALALFGCGGGGGGGSTPTADTGGGTGVNTPADLGNVSIYFPAPTGAALIDTSGLTRNAVRLVATHEAVIDQQCVEFLTATGVDPDEGPYTLTECNDPYKKLIGTAGVDQFIVDRTIDDFNADNFPYGPNPGAYIDIVELVAEAISDTALPNGTGTAYLSVPPGIDFTLHVLTYVSGEFTAVANSENDTFVAASPAPVIPATANARIPMTTNTRNLLLEYFQSDTIFDIIAGANTGVNLTPAIPLAELVLPPAPVLSGDSYPVSAILSDALRVSPWYLRTVVTPDPVTITDSSADWLIREVTDINTSTGNGAITVNTDVIAATAIAPAVDPPYTIWNHGQFFINADLLALGENWSQWTHGTTDSGELNTKGGVVILP